MGLPPAAARDNPDAVFDDVVMDRVQQTASLFRIGSNTIADVPPFSVSLEAESGPSIGP